VKRRIFVKLRFIIQFRIKSVGEITERSPTYAETYIMTIASATVFLADEQRFKVTNTSDQKLYFAAIAGDVK